MSFEILFHLNVAISRATSDQLFTIACNIKLLQEARETASKHPSLENKRDVLEMSDALASSIHNLIK